MKLQQLKGEYMRSIYHPPQVDIIPKVYHPFRKGRISLKNDKFLSKLVVFHVFTLRKCKHLKYLDFIEFSAILFLL